MENALTLNPIQQLVLSKLYASDKDAAPIRDAVDPGSYNGEMIVRVKYGVKVGADFTSRVAAAVPWQTIACACLDRLAPQVRDAVVRAALDAVTGAVPETWAARKAATEEAVRSIVGKTERTVRGRVTLIADASLVTAAGTVQARDGGSRSKAAG